MNLTAALRLSDWGSPSSQTSDKIFCNICTDVKEDGVGQISDGRPTSEVQYDRISLCDLDWHVKFSRRVTSAYLQYGDGPRGFGFARLRVFLRATRGRGEGKVRSC